MPSPDVRTDTLLHGRYRVTRPLGRGGMGAVYEAVDTRLQNIVAIKQVLIDGADADRAFEREAMLLAGLRHPALPVVIDYFAEDHGRFFVMQFIDGEDLAHVLERTGGPCDVHEVHRWALAILDALHYLHTLHPPIVHRDIKPANLTRTPRGDIVLLDFGLAKGARASMPQPLDVLVQVRFADSPVLGLEDWPTRARPPRIEQASDPCTLSFPADPAGGRLPARVRIAVAAPDFRIEGAADLVVDVPYESYSKRLVFLLTPMRAGFGRVYVTLTAHDDVHLGTIVVETEASPTATATAGAVHAASLVLAPTLVAAPTLAPPSFASPTPGDFSRMMTPRPSTAVPSEGETPRPAAPSTTSGRSRGWVGKIAAGSVMAMLGVATIAQWNRGAAADPAALVATPDALDSAAAPTIPPAPRADLPTLPLPAARAPGRALASRAVRREVDGILAAIRSGSRRPDDVSEFFTQGDGHTVTARAIRERVQADGSTRVTFELLLERTRDRGAPDVRVAAVAFMLVPGDAGAVGHTLRVGPLRMP
jgi:hypothetical protein